MLLSIFFQKFGQFFLQILVYGTVIQYLDGFKPDYAVYQYAVMIFYFFYLPQKWPIFSKLNNLALCFLYFLYIRGIFFDIRTDLITFCKFLTIRPKIFKIDVFRLKIMFVGGEW